jgi:hypothetical protein
MWKTVSRTLTVFPKSGCLKLSQPRAISRTLTSLFSLALSIFREEKKENLESPSGAPF